MSCLTITRRSRADYRAPERKGGRKPPFGALAFGCARAYPLCRQLLKRGNAVAVRIYHNPRCNTSRKTLALLREKGVEPEVVEYLRTPYTTAQLRTLLTQLGIPARALVRKKEAAAAGIDPATMSEEALIEAMAKNPIIVERPIVVSGNKAALGRPPEKALDVLERRA
jgi:arsenate reductase (glutaredoxin)